MTKGTKIRTILGIAVSINTALAVTDVAQFGNDTVNLIYKIASLLVNAVIVGINSYYNNDYTEEACLGTAYTRHLKEVKSEDYIGEDFTKVGEDNE